MVTVAVSPLHKIGFEITELATKALGSEMLTEIESEHPLSSVTVKVYVPAAKLFTLEDEAPLDHE